MSTINWKLLTNKILDKSGLTQGKLAKACLVTQQAISGVKLGRREPGPQLALKLKEFATDLGIDIAKYEIPDFLKEPKMVKLLEKLEQLTPIKRTTTVHGFLNQLEEAE